MKPGIYIHIPFCVQKCSYCDFYSIADLSALDRFVDALCTEMRIALRAYGSMFAEVDTVYFGGGTPSVLGAARIERILAAVRDTFTLLENSEITVEINPGTIKGAFLQDIKAAGVNRVSIGVQSFDDEDLVFLGRCHTGDDARSAIHNVKELYDNYSIDLIHSIPGQKIERYRDSLQEAVCLGVPHISAYALTIEHNTPLYKLHKKGTISSVSEEDAVAFLETTINMLTNNTYLHYEISNFAWSETYISKHNSKYWDFTPYIGLGPSGHSFDGTHRWANVANVKEYCRKIKEGLIPLGNEELLNREEQFLERIMLGLRQVDKGIDINYLRTEHPKRWNIAREDKLADLIQQGYLVQKSDHVMLSKEGILVYNMIVWEISS